MSTTRNKDCNNTEGTGKRQRRRRRSSSEKRTVSILYKTKSLNKQADTLRSQIKDLEKKSSSPKLARNQKMSTQNASSTNKTKPPNSIINPIPKKNNDNLFIHQQIRSPALSPIRCSSPSGTSSSSSSSSSSGSDTSSCSSCVVSITAPDPNSFENGSPSRKKQKTRRVVILNSEIKPARPKVNLNFGSIEFKEDGELSDEMFSRKKVIPPPSSPPPPPPPPPLPKSSLNTRVTKFSAEKGGKIAHRESAESESRRKYRLPSWLRKSIGFNNELLRFIAKQDIEGLYQVVKENSESLQHCKEKMELKWAVDRMEKDQPESEHYKQALDHYHEFDPNHAERLEKAYHKDMRHTDKRRIEEQLRTRKISLNGLPENKQLPDLRNSIRNPPLRRETLPPLPTFRERPSSEHCRYEPELGPPRQFREREEVIHRRDEIIHRNYREELIADQHRRGFETRRVYGAETKLRRNGYVETCRPYPAY